jgi:endogenous inhibitor of DNA gyrase (YacG/DUF329 family)
MPQNTKIDDAGTDTIDISASQACATEMRQSAEISCPHCGKIVAWSAASLFRPFCSERCRLIDLGAWANDSHRIAGADLAPGDEDTY